LSEVFRVAWLVMGVRIFFRFFWWLVMIFELVFSWNGRICWVFGVS
jgi:hypothetical protein